MSKCIICQARIPGDRWNTNTCSPTCLKARDNGRTLEEQITHEMEQQGWPSERILPDSFEPSPYQQNYTP